MRFSFLAAAALLAAAARPAHAQPRVAPDSLPTAAGRWALEGGLAGTNPVLGALRFLSPRSAIGFNASGGYMSQNPAEEGTPFSNAGYRVSTLEATLGYRRYGTLRGGLAPLMGAGAIASYQRYESGVARTSWGTGVYGELGAAYLVASRLSVNAGAQLQVRRLRELYFLDTTNLPPGADAPSDGTRRSDGWSVQLGGVRLSATLFF